MPRPEYDYDEHGRIKHLISTQGVKFIAHYQGANPETTGITVQQSGKEDVVLKEGQFNVESYYSPKQVDQLRGKPLMTMQREGHLHKFPTADVESHLLIVTIDGRDWSGRKFHYVDMDVVEADERVRAIGLRGTNDAGNA